MWYVPPKSTSPLNLLTNMMDYFHAIFEPKISATKKGIINASKIYDMVARGNELSISKLCDK